MNTNKLFFPLIGLLAGFYFVSCTTSTHKLPPAVGSAGEVLVVMSDHLWKGACGDSVRQFLTEPVMGLPAPEPMFTLSQQRELSSFMQKFRNILIVNVDPGYERANLKYRTNVYTNNQLIYNLDAPSADSVIACMYKNKDLITAHFLVKGRDAIIEDYRKSVAKPVVEKVNEKFRVDILIPKPYLLNDEKEDFVWMIREENEKYWGILIWEEPYVRTSQLEPDSLIAKMNAMTRKYVSGNLVGSYMADEPTVPPEVKRFEKNGVYCVQMNGLWQLENGFMGGPYVNHTIVDVNRGMIVTGLGFVFYPNRDKRQMVRQLEAILYTMMPAETNNN
jgi:hypothetical protein